MVEGVQFVGAPKQVSRTKMSLVPLVFPTTRSLAVDSKATYRPLALIESAKPDDRAPPVAVLTV